MGKKHPLTELNWLKRFETSTENKRLSFLSLHLAVVIGILHSSTKKCTKMYAAREALVFFLLVKNIICVASVAVAFLTA